MSIRFRVDTFENLASEPPSGRLQLSAKPITTRGFKLSTLYYCHSLLYRRSDGVAGGDLR